MPRKASKRKNGQVVVKKISPKAPLDIPQESLLEGAIQSTGAGALASTLIAKLRARQGG